MISCVGIATAVTAVISRPQARVFTPRRQLLRVRLPEMPASTIRTPTKPSRKLFMPLEVKKA